MKCQDCKFYNQPVGRIPNVCRDREDGEAESCLQFEPYVPEPQTPDPASVVGALGQQHYRDIMHEILSESFVLEQDVTIAIDTIRAQLQTQGVNITMDAASFRSMASKVIDLYVLYRLTCAVGLGRFADTIVNHEIARRFSTEEKHAKVVR